MIIRDYHIWCLDSALLVVGSDKIIKLLYFLYKYFDHMVHFHRYFLHLYVVVILHYILTQLGLCYLGAQHHQVDHYQDFEQRILRIVSITHCLYCQKPLFLFDLFGLRLLYDLHGYVRPMISYIVRLKHYLICIFYVKLYLGYVLHNNEPFMREILNRKLVFVADWLVLHFRLQRKPVEIINRLLNNTFH